MKNATDYQVESERILNDILLAIGRNDKEDISSCLQRISVDWKMKLAFHSQLVRAGEKVMNLVFRQIPSLFWLYEELFV